MARPLEADPVLDVAPNPFRESRPQRSPKQRPSLFARTPKADEAGAPLVGEPTGRAPKRTPRRRPTQPVRPTEHDQPAFDPPQRLDRPLDPDRAVRATPLFDRELDDEAAPAVELDATPVFGRELELDAAPQFSDDNDIELDPTPVLGDEPIIELDATPGFSDELDRELNRTPTFADELDDERDSELDAELGPSPLSPDEIDRELNRTPTFADELDDEPVATLTFNEATPEPATETPPAANDPEASRPTSRRKRRSPRRPTGGDSAPQPDTKPRRGPMVAAALAVAVAATAIVLWPHGTSTDYYLPVPVTTAANATTTNPTTNGSAGVTATEGSAIDATGDDLDPKPMNAGAGTSNESFVSDTVMELIDARLCRNPWADPVTPEPFDFDNADEVRYCESDELQISVGRFSSPADLSEFAIAAEQSFSKSDVDPGEVMVVTRQDNVVVTAFSPDGDGQRMRNWIVDAADATGGTSASLTELEADPAG